MKGLDEQNTGITLNNNCSSPISTYTFKVEKHSLKRTANLENDILILNDDHRQIPNSKWEHRKTNT